MKAGVKVGHESHVGRVRSVNEDSSCALAAPHTRQGIDAFLAVADGMGWHQAGEVASRHLIDALCRRFSALPAGERGQDDPTIPDRCGALLEEAIQSINEELYAMASSREELHGMGTTVVAAIVAWPHVFIGHVGDSRAYLVSHGHIQQLTQDHSWVAEQVRVGLLKPEEARFHPRRNIITRALGSGPQVKLDSLSLEVAPRDIIVLCTDGLSNMVTDEEILKEVTRGSTPDSGCQALVNLANQRGGTDNITVAVARIERAAPPPGATAASHIRPYTIPGPPAPLVLRPGVPCFPRILWR